MATDPPPNALCESVAPTRQGGEGPALPLRAYRCATSPRQRAVPPPAFALHVIENLTAQVLDVELVVRTVCGFLPPIERASSVGLSEDTSGAAKAYQNSDPPERNMRRSTASFRTWRPPASASVKKLRARVMPV